MHLNIVIPAWLYNEESLPYIETHQYDNIASYAEDILENEDKKYIIVVNKKDLEKKINLDKYNLDNIIYTDTVTDTGMNPLKDKIIELFNIDELENDNDAYFTNERQISLAKEALSILDDVNKGVENEVPVDLIEIDIKRIWTKLGEILGENYDEELIDQLFSNFCLGK